MTSARFGTVALVVVASSLGGCGFGGWGSYYDDGYDDGYYDGARSGNLVVDNGHQSGEMGEIRDYSAETFQQYGSSYPGSTNVRLDSQGRGWWVMTSITISGVDLDALAPGVVYATPASGVYEEGEPQIDVLGCSGPSFGNYTFDTHAERAEIEVEDLGQGARRVFFRAWFRGSSGTQVAEGEFDVRTTG